MSYRSGCLEFSPDSHTKNLLIGCHITSPAICTYPPSLKSLLSTHCWLMFCTSGRWWQQYNNFKELVFLHPSHFISKITFILEVCVFILITQNGTHIKSILTSGSTMNSNICLGEIDTSRKYKMKQRYKICVETVQNWFQLILMSGMT